MTESELKYKKTVNKIGAGMLIFLALFNLLVMIWSLAAEIFKEIFSPVATEIITELLYAVIYLSAFILPTLFIKLMLRSDYRPIPFKLRLPRETGLYILCGIASILMMAYLNADFLEIFNYSKFTSDAVGNADKKEIYQIILNFLTTAVVPGICEEILFRGAVLGNLKPFGKAPAIIISALLFGLMHQNAGQFLYATAAGLILGWIAYETGSVLCGMLLHFLNNFVSVVEEALFATLESDTAAAICYTLELVIVAAGLISAVILIIRFSKKKRSGVFDDGIFGKSLSDLADPDGREMIVSGSRATRLFFSPCMIIFMALTAVEMMFLIISSILYSIV